MSGFSLNHSNCKTEEKEPSPNCTLKNILSNAKKLYPDDVLIAASENDFSILAIYEHKKYLHQTSLYLRKHTDESVQLLGTIDLCLHYSADINNSMSDFIPYAYIISLDIFFNRGLGFGSFLLQAAKKYCFNLGIKRLVGDISCFDLERQQGRYGEMLIHFYQKNGFHVSDSKNNSKRIEIYLN